jgi:hypothetical protein
MCEAHTKYLNEADAQREVRGTEIKTAVQFTKQCAKRKISYIKSKRLAKVIFLCKSSL